MVVAVPHPTIARDHCLAPSRTIDAPLRGVSGKYGRLFPSVAPFTADEDFLIRLGQSEGLCDGGPDANDDDAGVAAGWPLFGQFIAHDITADRSLLLQHADADHIANFRTPRANLECLYGDGPTGNPFLYDRDDPAKLLIGSNDQGAPGDLPRNAQGIALIGDPRNDVHVFVSQLHLAMLKVHNLLVDRLREATARSAAATACRPAARSCRCSPTCSASGRCPPVAGSTGRSCLRSPAGPRRSRARRSTGAWHAA